MSPCCITLLAYIALQLLSLTWFVFAVRGHNKDSPDD